MQPGHNIPDLDRICWLAFLSFEEQHDRRHQSFRGSPSNLCISDLPTSTSLLCSPHKPRPPQTSKGNLNTIARLPRAQEPPLFSWHPPPLPYLLGNDVHHSLESVRALAPCLLREVAHGSALIQQSQLSCLVRCVSGVPVDATIEHGAVEVTHQAANVAGGVRLSVGGILRKREGCGVKYMFLVTYLTAAGRYICFGTSVSCGE